MLHKPMLVSDKFAAIPQELKDLPNWCCWKYALTPYGTTKVPYSTRTGQYSSSDDPATWVTFTEAVAACPHYDGIGFYFSKAAGYVGIDLDFTEDPKLLPAHDMIRGGSQSYCERSPSGKGYHIITKGSVKRGVKSSKAKIEMYDERRFFTMTGDAVRPVDPVNEQPMIDYIYSQILQVSDVELTDPNDRPEVEDDATVYNRAAFAANAEKFVELFQGHWQKHYQSQSEADQALINIIAFYTNNFEQTKRLFKHSHLGKRDKAARDNYVMPMIKKAQDRKPMPLADQIKLTTDFNELLRKQAEREAAQEVVASVAPMEAAGSDEPDNATQPAAPPSEPERGTTSPAAARQASAFHPPASSREWALNPPPGLMRDVASFIYAQSRLPVAEIALSASLGLLGGLAGRAFNVEGAALNIYVTLLARTGRGKEAMSSGIDKIVTAMKMTAPAASRIVGPSVISSGQSLIPYIQHTSNSFVSVLTEFDSMLSQMSQKNASPAIAALNRNLLALYSKSAQGDTFGSVAYADKAKNTDVLQAPCMTILAECTITHMLETVNEGMVSSGLLPRFVNIVYEGERVDDNENALTFCPQDLAKRLTHLFNICMQLNQTNRVLQVQIDDDARQYLNGVNRFCIAKLNAKGEQKFDDLWNRVHLNVRKIAALAALGPDAHNIGWESRISLAHAKWATQIVFNSAYWWINSFNKAEIGDQTNDVAQLRDTRRICKKFFTLSAKQHRTYHATEQMVKDWIVPARYLQAALGQMASFRNDKRGAINALKNVLATMVSNGELIDMTKLPPNEYKFIYGTSMAAYRVSLLQDEEGGGFV